MFLVRNRQFKPYWFETGTPAFLIELMEKDGFAPEKMEKLSCRDTDFSTYEVVNPASLPILFQSGYLTIYDYQSRTDISKDNFNLSPVITSLLLVLTVTFENKLNVKTSINITIPLKFICCLINFYSFFS